MSHILRLNQVGQRLRLTLSVTLGLLANASVSFAAEAVTTEAWVTVSTPDYPMVATLPVPDNAASVGVWTQVYDWPMNGLHATLLPNGKVLTFGTNPDGENQDGRYYDVWDPSLGMGLSAHDTVYDPIRQDSFCAASSFLADGSLMISGGNGATTSTIYDSGSNSSYTENAELAADRWYATMINLADGRPIMLGGIVPYTEGMVYQPELAIALGLASMTPEVFEGGQWRSLFGANSRLAFGPDYLRASYPRAWVAPNGGLFGISADQMWQLDPDANGGNGSISILGQFKPPFSYDQPVNVGSTNSAVMYDIGKILQVGGNGGYNGDELPASNMATAVDINGATPIITEQPAMSFSRRYPNTIVLASGEVVVTGGVTYGNMYPGQPAAAVYAAEIWNPTSGTWRTCAQADRYRGYHSITTLLPDGSILSTGGGTPGPVTNLNAEIYYPPYLFQAKGLGSEWAPRPSIQAINGLVHEPETALQVDMQGEGTIAQLVLLGLSNGTHSFNSGQRRVPLAFTQDKYRLSAMLPGANIVPPGYYQVVAVNNQGTPSKGVIIAMGADQAIPPVVVEPYNPPSLDSRIATPQISAGQTATYSVTPQPGVSYRWFFSNDGTQTDYSSSASITHQYNQAGLYVVTLTAKSANGDISTQAFLQAVSTDQTSLAPSTSSQMLLQQRESQEDLLWTINSDNNSVTVLGTAPHRRIAEINVGIAPQAIALAPDGRLWVSNRDSSSISIINSNQRQVVQTLALAPGSQPYGLVISAATNEAFVALEASGEVIKLNATSGTILDQLAVGSNVRHLSISGDGERLLATRFISPPAPGESGVVVDTANANGEVLVIASNNLSLENTIELQYSTKVDTEIQGSGLPNYLAAAAISPDGSSAWIPSKQDNIGRGVARNGLPLDFQNTVRAISSKINLATQSEVYQQRVDHDNSSVASAALYHPNGVYLFVALETSREIAVLNAVDGVELFRIGVGMAPQGLALSADGLTLYVKEMISRQVNVIDLSSLIEAGQQWAASSTKINTVSNELLADEVLQGKALFYDAKDPRLARDAYMSCASCHQDGGHDGRVWDMTGFGEGLRNTINLLGRGGTQHGRLHWSSNFDEVQDFEQQIRNFAGGTGLMSELHFNAGTRSDPLGDKKAGVSADLDHLAAYVASLNIYPVSPFRNDNGTLTAAAQAGKLSFAQRCQSCHGGMSFAASADGEWQKDIGTLTADSGQQSGGPLTGIDVPTLRDAWYTAPYLHNGSAATLEDAILAHNGISVSTTELDQLVAYVQQIGSEEVGDNKVPQVTMTSPKPAVTYYSGSDIEITVDALDPDGAIMKVDFFYNGNKFHTAYQPPYTYIAPKVPTGTYNLHAEAYDFAGAKSISATVKTSVVWDNRPNQAPTVTMVAPLTNIEHLAGTDLVLMATAEDADGTINRVEFYSGGNLLGTDKTKPFSYTVLNAQAGSYQLHAKAYDNDGASSISDFVSIDVIPGSNLAPEVRMVKPSDNQFFWPGSNIEITAEASDPDGSISEVDFYYNGVYFYTDRVKPYTFTALDVPRGRYTLTAVARDNEGMETTSNPHQVRVGF